MTRACAAALYTMEGIQANKQSTHTVRTWGKRYEILFWTLQDNLTLTYFNKYSLSLSRYPYEVDSHYASYIYARFMAYNIRNLFK